MCQDPMIYKLQLWFTKSVIWCVLISFTIFVLSFFNFLLECLIFFICIFNCIVIFCSYYLYFWKIKYSTEYKYLLCKFGIIWSSPKIWRLSTRFDSWLSLSYTIFYRIIYTWNFLQNNLHHEILQYWIWTCSNISVYSVPYISAPYVRIGYTVVSNTMYM